MPKMDSTLVKPRKKRKWFQFLRLVVEVVVDRVIKLLTKTKA
jgi:hypothetical protein